MPLRKPEGSNRVGRYGGVLLDDEPTFRRRKLLPDHGLTWTEFHFASQFSRDGNLASFGNGGPHMIKLSCIWLFASCDFCRPPPARDSFNLKFFPNILTLQINEGYSQGTSHYSQEFEGSIRPRSRCSGRFRGRLRWNSPEQSEQGGAPPEPTKRVWVPKKGTCWTERARMAR